MVRDSVLCKRASPIADLNVVQSQENSPILENYLKPKESQYDDTYMIRSKLSGSLDDL